MKCIPDIYPGLCNINPENSQALLETNLPTSYMVSEKGISYMLYVCYSCQHLGHLWGMNIWVPRALSHSCTNVGSGTFEHPSKLPGCFICQALTNTLEWWSLLCCFHLIQWSGTLSWPWDIQQSQKLLWLWWFMTMGLWRWWSGICCPLGKRPVRWMKRPGQAGGWRTLYLPSRRIPQWIWLLPRNPRDQTTLWARSTRSTNPLTNWRF